MKGEGVGGDGREGMGGHMEGRGGEGGQVTEGVSREEGVEHGGGVVERPGRGAALVPRVQQRVRGTSVSTLKRFCRLVVSLIWPAGSGHVSDMGPSLTFPLVCTAVPVLLLCRNSFLGGGAGLSPPLPFPAPVRAL